MRNAISITITVIFIATILSSSSAYATTIPNWIKNTSKYWSEDQINDSDFVKAIQYLVQQGIIKVPDTQKNASSTSQIPHWIKNNAGWWADNQISDDDFVKGIEYLVQSGIIQVQQQDNTPIDLSKIKVKQEFANDTYYEFSEILPDNSTAKVIFKMYPNVQYTSTNEEIKKANSSGLQVFNYTHSIDNSTNILKVKQSYFISYDALPNDTVQHLKALPNSTSTPTSGNFDLIPKLFGVADGFYANSGNTAYADTTELGVEIAEGVIFPSEIGLKTIGLSEVVDKTKELEHTIEETKKDNAECDQDPNFPQNEETRKINEKTISDIEKDLNVNKVMIIGNELANTAATDVTPEFMLVLHRGEEFFNENLKYVFENQIHDIESIHSKCKPDIQIEYTIKTEIGIGENKFTEDHKGTISFKKITGTPNYRGNGKGDVTVVDTGSCAGKATRQYTFNVDTAFFTPPNNLVFALSLPSPQYVLIHLTCEGRPGSDVHQGFSWNLPSSGYTIDTREGVETPNPYPGGTITFKVIKGI